MTCHNHSSVMQYHNNAQGIIMLLPDEGTVFTLYRPVNFADTFFFVVKGPRSRCYGRTAALRLIVQPL
jgi:hypothetical protein